MFILSTLRDNVRVAPADFRKTKADALRDEINKKYANKAVQDVGLCICLFDILEADEGFVQHGDGCSYYKVKFRLIVLRPFEGEVIEGTVSNCTEKSIRVSLGFFDDIQVPPSEMKDNCEFDPQEQAYVWKVGENNAYIDPGEEIRVRVVSNKFVDVSPGRTAVNGGAGSIAAGNSTNSSGEGGNKLAPFTVVLLSRTKAALSPFVYPSEKTLSATKRQVPTLEEFINDRDYTGAVTLLEFEKAAGKSDIKSLLWLAYASFHLGHYQKAMEIYEELIKQPKCDPMIYLNLGITYFYLGMYKEADEVTQKGPNDKLQNRLFFHLSQKFNDEKRLMKHHGNLQDVPEDQLTLASMHYLRGHYQEAVDIYKRLLLDYRDFQALNVYLALCYYKLDYYDVSQEVLSLYLQHYPDSVIGCNLKACNHFRLYNGKAAEQELNSLTEKLTDSCEFAREIIKHNLVVFRNGGSALQILTPLIDVVPEARLNLVIYHLRNGETVPAFNLMENVEPTTPQEYILKGIVNAALGQEQDSREYIKTAQQFFQLVGGSASECDTIPGRQCMASCFFLLKQFEDVLVYLNSIKAYFFNDDTFNYNYGQTKVANGEYAEAEEILSMIQNEKFKNEYAYLSHLAKCYIMNKKAKLAWELYVKMETSSESFSLLQLIANDCYKTQQYYYSAKAFDILERLDPIPEYWEGKRGACIGVFQSIYNGIENSEYLRDVVMMLKNSSEKVLPQVEYIVRVIKRWAKDNRVVV
ncbi:RNA polymerase III subunit Rpc25-domain-containing protein [Paraphysoderma sedebokerense]|nr:RNA polymerase III subunit Rpc25-domain-containing protein [Paraphysoderma sedebokerense]